MTVRKKIVFYAFLEIIEKSIFSHFLKNDRKKIMRFAIKQKLIKLQNSPGIHLKAEYLCFRMHTQ